MNRLLTVSGALLLSASLSQTSLAQGRSDDNPGKGKGGGSERAQARDDHPGKGNGNGRDKADRAESKGRDKGEERARFDDQRPDRPAVVVVDDRGRDRDRDSRRDDERQIVFVPYPYRDRYADSANALYRYNDGAIYQLDPTTQVIQAVVQLLA